MLEILISLSIMGTFLVSMLSAISVSALTTRTVELQSYANDLARNEMEYVLSYTYLTPPDTYPLISNVPAGYTITASTAAVNGYDTLSKITVTVSRSSRVLVTLDNLRASP